MAPPSASVIKTNIQAADSGVWSEADYQHFHPP